MGWEKKIGAKKATYQIFELKKKFELKEKRSQAEPSWGTLIFELKTSWIFSLIYSFFCFNFLFSPPKLGVLRRNSITFTLFCCKWYWFFSYEKRKLDLKKLLSNFRAEKKVRAEGKKVTSRVEPSWKYFSSSYGSSQLGSDSSLEFRYEKQFPVWGFLGLLFKF